MSATNKGSDFSSRLIKARDSNNNQIGSTLLNNPLYKDSTEIVRQVPANHDIIGASVTTDP